MSRKEELLKEQDKLQELWTDNSNQLEKIRSEEKLLKKYEEFREYKYKIHIYHELSSKDKIKDVTLGDLKIATWSKTTGFPYVSYPGGMGTSDDYILLKSKDDYEVAARVYRVLNAIDHVKHANDKSGYIKTILSGGLE